MEPIQFNLNVSIEVKDSTIEKLKEVCSLLAASVMMHGNPAAVKDLAEALKADGPEGKEETPAPAESVKETAVTEVPRQALFDAVKAAQKERKVKPDTVRAVFAEFGITSSSECPAERRAELLERINAL